MKRSELDLLYRSLDSSLTPVEQSRLDAAMRRDPGLHDEYERLVRLRSLVENQESPSFRADFSQRVMERLAAESTAGPASNPVDETTLAFGDALSHMFRKMAVAASVAAVLLLTYNLVTSESVSINTSFGLTEELYPEDLYDARIALESEGEL